MEIKDFLSRLKNVKKTSSGWTALCAAHPDNNNSLAISEGDDGRILLHCHDGCSIDQICGALGIHKRELFDR